jgi:hypothetical protein
MRLVVWVEASKQKARRRLQSYITKKDTNAVLQMEGEIKLMESCYKLNPEARTSLTLAQLQTEFKAVKGKKSIKIPPGVFMLMTKLYIHTCIFNGQYTEAASAFRPWRLASEDLAGICD